MSVQADVRRLCAELNQVGATQVQRKLAVILWTVNGLENALAFVAKVPELKALHAQELAAQAATNDS